jgi:hypothetical protein
MGAEVMSSIPSAREASLAQIRSEESRHAAERHEESRSVPPVTDEERLLTAVDRADGAEALLDDVIAERDAAIKRVADMGDETERLHKVARSGWRMALAYAVRCDSRVGEREARKALAALGDE